MILILSGGIKLRINIQDKNLFEKAMLQILPDLSFPEYTGVTIDSRKVEPGDIFLALKGENTDGHQYIKQAHQAGSSMAFVEKATDTSTPVFQVPSTRQFLNDLAAVYRKNFSCPLIGITGSNGKTTTKDLLYHVLTSSINVMSTKGNFNSTVGVPLSLFECGKDVDAAIIEMGASKPGEIEYICNIAQPDMGLITNIYEAHLQYFGDIEAVAKTKSALFSSLPESGTAFINKDDNYISNMTVPCNRIEYSFTLPTYYRGNWVNVESCKALTVNDTPVNLHIPSKAMGMNALAVFAIASNLGMDSITIAAQIGSFQTPAGRGDIIKIQDVMVINDSYNANLESTRTGINNLASQYKGRRKIAVLGDMLELGNMEKKHHQALGKYLSEKKVDAVFAYGDLTRHTILAMNGAAEFHQFYGNKTSLLTDLKDFIKEGDIIYLKGSRGMKMEEIITGLQG